ncbi:MAG: hypothetical protein SH856_03905 [Flavobacteriales bacterium]|nr:hypothetical protein [Flavobacteriales bacterium]
MTFLGWLHCNGYSIMVCGGTNGSYEIDIYRNLKKVERRCHANWEEVVARYGKYFDLSELTERISKRTAIEHR